MITTSPFETAVQSSAKLALASLRVTRMCLRFHDQFAIDGASYFASGKTGSMSTGTSFSLSMALFIAGRITPYLSSIAFALS